MVFGRAGVMMGLGRLKVMLVKMEQQPRTEPYFKAMLYLGIDFRHATVVVPFAI